MLSPKNYNNLKDKTFIPMYDKVFNLNGFDKQDRQINLSFAGKRLPHKKCHYDANVNSHEWVYFMTAVSTDNVAASPNVSVYSRMYWKDI